MDPSFQGKHPDPASQGGLSPSVPPAATPPVETVVAGHQAVPPTAGEQCPSCGAPMMSDQRYCLGCGQRRGDPRLPFMDAVVFMDAMKRPPQTAPTAQPRKRRISPNAALIAGVGTLLLAMGIGVIIGQSGNNTVAGTTPPPVQVVKVGGGGEEAKTASSGKPIGGGSAGGKAKSQKQVAPEEDAHPAAEEVLKPTGDVKLPPPTVKPGGKCPKGSAGCEHGEFTGDFFGE